jgi:hypothetical protein
MFYFRHRHDLTCRWPPLQARWGSRVLAQKAVVQRRTQHPVLGKEYDVDWGVLVRMIACVVGKWIKSRVFPQELRESGN